MGIILFNKQRYLIAKEEAAKQGKVDDKTIIAEYKKICTGYLEGSNKELHNKPCYIRFPDKETKKVKKTKKK